MKRKDLISNKYGQKNKKDLKNKRFGRLIVLSDAGRKHGSVMWECKCECGKTKIIRGSFLLSGAITSCGCLSIEKRRLATQKPLGVSCFNRLVSEYKQGAKSRGLIFELSKEDCGELFKQNCHYCGVPPLQFFKGDWAKAYNGLYYYNGIDRKDNSAGYKKENCVACCTICNRAKHSLSEQDFLSWIDRLTTYKLLAKS